MSLTTAQLIALKNDIAADGTLGQLAHTADNAQAVADAYNAIVSPDFFVFRTNVPVADIYDQISWANFTPQDPPDTTVQWSNRSLACQGKQFNLQTLLQARTTFDASKITQRSGLNDATTNLSSGAGGASKNGGWVNILAILRRQATRLEKLFAVATTGVGTVGTDALGAPTNPALMQVETRLSGTDVQNAWNS